MRPRAVIASRGPKVSESYGVTDAWRHSWCGRRRIGDGAGYGVEWLRSTGLRLGLAGVSCCLAATVEHARGGHAPPAIAHALRRYASISAVHYWIEHGQLAADVRRPSACV